MFIYRILIPPLHQTARPRHLFFLSAQCIDEAAGHYFLYGHMPLIDAHYDGVEPSGLHCLLYLWVLPLSTCPTFSVIPVIHSAAQWWNPIRILIISPVTTHLSLPYNSTNCKTSFYIALQALTVAPVLSRNLTIMPHRLRNFRRFM